MWLCEEVSRVYLCCHLDRTIVSFLTLNNFLHQLTGEALGRPSAQVKTYTECLNLCDNFFPNLRCRVGRGRKFEFDIVTDDFRLKSREYLGSSILTNNGLSKLEKPSDQKPKMKFTRRNKSGEEKQIISLQYGEGLGMSEYFVY